MPFGVTGPSPVVTAVQSEYSLDLITYTSEDDLKTAAEDGEIYGGYVPGGSSDKLITVPAKSFFGEVFVRGGFAEAAKKSGRTFDTTVVAPLPTSDRTGAAGGAPPASHAHWRISHRLHDLPLRPDRDGLAPSIGCSRVLGRCRGNHCRGSSRHR